MRTQQRSARFRVDDGHRRRLKSTRTSPSRSGSTVSKGTKGSTLGSSPAAMILTYQYGPSTETVYALGSDLLVAIAGQPVVLVNDQRLYLCKLDVRGGQVAGSSACTAFPRSDAPRLASAYSDQYLHPLGGSGLAAALFTPGSSSTQTIAGLPSTCRAGPSKVATGEVDTLCASIDGGFLTYLREGARMQKLLTVKHGVAPSAFELSQGTLVTSNP
jgi:hypothetical protein